MKFRIIFKILLLSFRIINNCAPPYLTNLLETYIPKRSLRSATLNTVVVPRSKTTTYGDRAFTIAAPKLWNSLPSDLRSAESLPIFMYKLKTHLFNVAFN